MSKIYLPILSQISSSLLNRLYQQRHFWSAVVIGAQGASFTACLTVWVSPCPVKTQALVTPLPTGKASCRAFIAFYCMDCRNKWIFSISHQDFYFCPPWCLASASSGKYLVFSDSPWNGKRVREADGRDFKAADFASLSAFLFPSATGEFSLMFLAVDDCHFFRWINSL